MGQPLQGGLRSGSSSSRWGQTGSSDQLGRARRVQEGEIEGATEVYEEAKGEMGDGARDDGGGNRKCREGRKTAGCRTTNEPTTRRIPQGLSIEKGTKKLQE